MNDTLSSKLEKSIPFFKNTRVETCSHVVIKNGQAVAVAYPSTSTGTENKSSPKVSTEKRSVSHDLYKVRKHLHAGMNKKPLEPYSPEAQRSRLKQEEFVLPYKNTSQIVIGDRGSKYKRHFVTTAQNLLKAPQVELSTNPGILSEKTKWTHSRDRS